MTGSHNNGSAHTHDSSHHALHPRDDRETLSALFDGELPGDSVRFALKRLEHDVTWRDTCGRWQMIGDALRGEATAVAPADFAANVMRSLSIATEADVAVAAPGAAFAAAASRRTPARWRWVGGAALAASVAMAALLVVRPSTQSAGPASDGQIAITSPAATTAPGHPAIPGKPDHSADPAGSLVAETVKVAAVAATTERSARRAARGARPLRAVSASPGQEQAPALAVASAAAAAVHPFHPSGDEIATRPWPRAVVPEASASGAFTVGFGATSVPSTYYPFEPRLPAEATAGNDQQR